MPIMPATGPTPPSYPSERADVWRAIEGLERRLAAPTAEPQAKTGTVTSMRPTVRVLGTEEDRLVWRVNTGTELQVDDEVLCVETALGLVVLSVVVQPPLGPGKPEGTPVHWTSAPIPVGFSAGDYWHAQTAAGTGWSTDTDGATETCLSLAPGDLAPSGAFMFLKSINPKSSWNIRTFPTPGGTSAIPITGGQSYFVRAYAETDSAWDDAETHWRAGVEWYDGAGGLISSDMGAAVGGETVNDGTWKWQDGETYNWVFEAVAPVTATLTSPPTAHFARPFLLSSSGASTSYWAVSIVSNFLFETAP